MASKVEICNLALSHVGAYRISSLSESTKEAKECNAFYSLALRAVLEDHNWSFARKRLTMALLTTTYSGWDYAYQYPTDCVCPRYITDVVGTSTGTSYDIDEDTYKAVGKVKYEVAADSALTSKVILTDKKSAELVYTANVTDTNMFTSKFVDAFALRLAAYLAQPLKGKEALRASLIGLYRQEMGFAQVSDANSDYKKEENPNTFVDARG